MKEAFEGFPIISNLVGLNKNSPCGLFGSNSPILLLAKLLDSIKSKDEIL